MCIIQYLLLCSLFYNLSVHNVSCLVCWLRINRWYNHNANIIQMAWMWWCSVKLTKSKDRLWKVDTYPSQYLSLWLIYSHCKSNIHRETDVIPTQKDTLPLSVSEECEECIQSSHCIAHQASQLWSCDYICVSKITWYHCTILEMDQDCAATSMAFLFSSANDVEEIMVGSKCWGINWVYLQLCIHHPTFQHSEQELQHQPKESYPSYDHWCHWQHYSLVSTSLSHTSNLHQDSASPGLEKPSNPLSPSYFLWVICAQVYQPNHHKSHLMSLELYHFQL